MIRKFFTAVCLAAFVSTFAACGGGDVEFKVKDQDRSHLDQEQETKKLLDDKKGGISQIEVN